MASAFQANAFQVNAFQIVGAVAVATPRGFEETLVLFALERRRVREEREIGQLMALEAQLISEAFELFARPNDAA